MKVYSWNVLRSNRKLPDLYNFIENLDFDVLCLQEVTEEMLSHFKKMPVQIAYNVERVSQVRQLFSKRKVVNYVVIQKWESISNLGAIYADINMGGKRVRVFSTHLALWNPQTRANEFAHLMEYLPKEGPIIVCGDFNVLEWAPVKTLNWFLGSSIEEAMPKYSERKLFEERFTKYNLANPLLGQITHKFSRSQLDHILVSGDLVVKKAWVIPEGHGSDHQPVGVELAV